MRIKSHHKLMKRKGTLFDSELIHVLSEASGINPKSLADNVVLLAKTTGKISVLKRVYQGGT